MTKTCGFAFYETTRIATNHIDRPNDDSYWEDRYMTSSRGNFLSRQMAFLRRIFFSTSSFANLFFFFKQNTRIYFMFVPQKNRSKDLVHQWCVFYSNKCCDPFKVTIPVQADAPRDQTAAALLVHPTKDTWSFFTDIVTEISADTAQASVLSMSASYTRFEQCLQTYFEGPMWRDCLYKEETLASESVFRLFFCTRYYRCDRGLSLMVIGLMVCHTKVTSSLFGHQVKTRNKAKPTCLETLSMNSYSLKRKEVIIILPREREKERRERERERGCFGGKARLKERGDRPDKLKCEAPKRSAICLRLSRLFTALQG